jgi:ABC-type multidrug transport system fused ATPase/permease subunit
MTRVEMVEACRMALLHDFVRDLPDGYGGMARQIAQPNFLVRLSSATSG